MSNNINKVLGKNVYLKVPPLPENKLELPEDAKKALFEKYMNSLDVLEVFDVGHECTWGLQPGDKVFVNPAAARSLIHFKIGKQDLAAIFENHILHIWS